MINRPPEEGYNCAALLLAWKWQWKQMRAERLALNLVASEDTRFSQVLYRPTKLDEIKNFHSDGQAGSVRVDT